MTRIGVLLYGPPASGKDTVTRLLHKRDSRFRPFRRIKCGPGRSEGYRMVTPGELAALPSSDVLWRNDQYEATYIVDRPELHREFDAGVPVVHVGQPEAVAAIAEGMPDARWLRIALWCPRDETERRLHSRGSADVAQRLQVWDETPTMPPPVTTINTDDYEPQAVADLISAGAAAILRDIVATPL